MNRAMIISLAAALAAAEAHAGDLRTMLQNPGDWEVTVTGGFMPPTTQKACYRGDKSVADLTTAGLKKCNGQSVSIAGDRATVDAVCSLMNMRVSVHATVTPTGDASFHGESQVHIDGRSPIPGMPTDVTLSIDAHRVGPCQPGERSL